jgi:hypothetical protein
MADEHDRKRVEALTLIQSSDLTLPADEMERVIMLYEHFAAARATLAAQAMGEVEPVTIFQARHQGDQP